MEKGITDEKLQEIAKSVMFFKNGFQHLKIIVIQFM